MRIYGNKAGFIHRNAQPPPERLCPKCGKPVGAMWEQPELCLHCEAKAAKATENAELLKIGKRRCPKCGGVKRSTEFVNNKGTPRATCSQCRKQAMERRAAKAKERKGQEDAS